MRTSIALATLIATSLNAQQRTYANPIDVDYRYNFELKNQGISYRSGADPVIVVHKGEYYLFSTIADRSEEHTSELQSQSNLVCRLLLEKKKKKQKIYTQKS